ncbi:hypothetical protein BYT27DRAFT_7216176 [Phlegmacium glaucopus]|nr:hypothetical protein BYT27DRAFT_7216176 [Phlegmacium glaucopus]
MQYGNTHPSWSLFSNPLWLAYETNCTTVYYVQVSAPITSFTWVPHDHYLDREADNNINIALDKTTAFDCAKLAVIGGVVFLAIISTLILRRWKKQSTHPYPYDPVASPEVQIGYVDPIIPTSMAPEKISDVKVGEASSQEDELTGSVRRSSKSEVKRNPSRSTRGRPVATHPILLLKETEDRSTEEEEYYGPQPSRASRKAKRKSQRRSDRVTHDVDNSMAHIQGLGSASNSPIGLPGGHFPHHASYCPIWSPGTNANSGVGNITHVTISGIGNNDSIDSEDNMDLTGAPRTHTQRTHHSEDCELYGNVRNNVRLAHSREVPVYRPSNRRFAHFDGAVTGLHGVPHI